MRSKKADTANFNDDIDTMIVTTEIFRDLLSAETARLQQAKIEHSGLHAAKLTMPEMATDPEHYARLHRMRMAADHFLSALSGQY
jgi:hypothetical protein